MNRKVYESDTVLSLVEYMPEDDAASYENWLDPETASGYNFAMTDTFEEYSARESTQRFLASIMLNDMKTIIGSIGLSPENGPPDLSIRIYRPFRGQGYGSRGFLLGIKYCFETLQLEVLYAGCYPHNQASQRMLQKCGFAPHPVGDVVEKHYLTGAPLIQRDFVLYKPEKLRES